ncbi:hypothetical protein RIF29_14723 [Crotalaria pallida]|uniref:Uncharacterized protein n=1 Tax=Crotalaria pallida TaxID=3830 RepID=A0AAN9FDU2_CROPI
MFSRLVVRQRGRKRTMVGTRLFSEKLVAFLAKGNSEEEKSTKTEKPFSPVTTDQANQSNIHVYPNWAAMQVDMTKKRKLQSIKGTCFTLKKKYLKS